MIVRNITKNMIIAIPLAWIAVIMFLSFGDYLMEIVPGREGDLILEFLIPFLEEIFKFSPLFYLYWRGEKDIRKYVIAGFSTAIAYWVVENVWYYYYTFSIEVLIIRFLLPGHIFIMGLALGSMEEEGLLFSFIIAYLTHMAYNSLCNVLSSTPIPYLIFTMGIGVVEWWGIKHFDFSSPN